MLPEQGLNTMQTQCKQGVEETPCSTKTLVLKGEVQRDFAIFFLQTGRFPPVLSQTRLL